MENLTSNYTISVPSVPRSKWSSLPTTAFFLIGAIANILALWIIYKSSKTRNRKHVFLLRCLATNDLVAQIGMLVIINLNKTFPTYWNCVGFVILRGFGLGSGCVAFVMALERWLALTRPFLYHQAEQKYIEKVVTYKFLKIFTFSLWIATQILTDLPLVGIGLFYSSKETKCKSYRDATELKDVIYAFSFFAYASILCLCIALCNTTVVWELMKIKKQSKVLVRRVSRSTFINRPGSAKYQTPEEVAFAILMVIICVIFLLCWVPQLVCLLLTQLYSVKFTHFGTVANLLMCIYFTTDPFVYVLQRYNRDVFKYLLPCCFYRRSTISLTPTGTTTTTTPTSVLLPPKFPENSDEIYTCKLGQMS